MPCTDVDIINIWADMETLTCRGHNDPNDDQQGGSIITGCTPSSQGYCFKAVGLHHLNRYMDVGRHHLNRYRDVGLHHLNRYMDVGLHHLNRYRDVGLHHLNSEAAGGPPRSG